MALEWGTPTTPSFNPEQNVTVTAQKSTGPGAYEYVQMGFEVRFSIEGPAPSEADLLGYLATLYDALADNGWTILRFSQEATSSWEIAEV